MSLWAENTFINTFIWCVMFHFSGFLYVYIYIEKEKKKTLICLYKVFVVNRWHTRARRKKSELHWCRTVLPAAQSYHWECLMHSNKLKIRQKVSLNCWATEILHPGIFGNKSLKLLEGFKCAVNGSENAMYCFRSNACRWHQLLK